MRVMDDSPMPDDSPLSLSFRGFVSWKRPIAVAAAGVDCLCRRGRGGARVLGLARAPGGHRRLDHALITTDRDDLACASEQRFGRYRCEFRAPGVPWPDPPAPADRLVGFFTVDQQLYVIPGLFEQPALAARYASDESRKLSPDQRQRFAAACQLNVTGHLRNFQTRWLKTGDWGHQDEAPVATASDCRIP